MAKGWLGSSAPDEENLEHVRKGVIQGQEDLKVSIQEIVTRSQVLFHDSLQCDQNAIKMRMRLDRTLPLNLIVLTGNTACGDP